MRRFARKKRKKEKKKKGHPFIITKTPSPSTQKMLRL